MNSYELYVCSTDKGCWTMLKFDAKDDKSASEKASAAIYAHETDTGDFIYREYLYKNGEEIAM